MIYRGPWFLAVVSKLEHRHTGRLRKKDNLVMGERGGCGGEAKSYEGGKAWFSINNAILSEILHNQCACSLPNC